MLNRIGTFDNNCIKLCSQLADIMSVCSGYDYQERDTTLVHQKMSLGTVFSPVCRVTTNVFFSKRGFEHCAINALPALGYAFHVIVFGKAKSPECEEKSRTLPSCKMRVGRAGTAESIFG
jgi:hypothetical protein